MKRLLYVGIVLASLTISSNTITSEKPKLPWGRPKIHWAHFSLQSSPVQDMLIKGIIFQVCKLGTGWVIKKVSTDSDFRNELTTEIISQSAFTLFIADYPPAMLGSLFWGTLLAEGILVTIPINNRFNTWLKTNFPYAEKGIRAVGHCALRNIISYITLTIAGSLIGKSFEFSPITLNIHVSSDDIF